MVRSVQTSSMAQSPIVHPVPRFVRAEGGESDIREDSSRIRADRLNDMEQTIIQSIEQHCSSLKKSMEQQKTSMEQAFTRSTKQCFSDLEDLLLQQVKALQAITDAAAAGAETKAGSSPPTEEALRPVTKVDVPPIVRVVREEETSHANGDSRMIEGIATTGLAQGMRRFNTANMVDDVVTQTSEVRKEKNNPKVEKGNDDDEDSLEMDLDTQHEHMHSHVTSKLVHVMANHSFVNIGSGARNKLGPSESVLHSAHWYEKSLARIQQKQSVLMEAWTYSGLEKKLPNFNLQEKLPKEAPDNILARLSSSMTFRWFSMLVIFANAIWLGIETNASMIRALDRQDKLKWWENVDMFFSIYFLVELLIKMIGLRMWFIISPDDRGWNLFDFGLVVIVLITDLTYGVDLNFIRTLRVFRIIRVARVMRVLRVFRSLRRMMFAIMACLESLMWFFLFLGVVFYMCSIGFLQGAAESLRKNPDNDNLFDGLETWYRDLPCAMFSLLVAITGGYDWLEIRRPLTHVGWIYASAFPAFIMFVNIGVVNVLTGVFMENADEFADRDLIIQRESAKVDSFISEMLDLWYEFDGSTSGRITWEQFTAYFSDSSVQAYLAAHNLETSHADMLFKLLDKDRTGDIDLDEFVLGLIRLRGDAKATDVRIVLLALSRVLKNIEVVEKELEAVRRNQVISMTAV